MPADNLYAPGTFDTELHLFTSPDAQDPFGPRTGHFHMDIGMVKDTDNNLLPYYFQMNRTDPMTLKAYHLNMENPA